MSIIGSRATLSPKRRSIQPWHQELLAHPQQHGLKLREFTSASGIPCIICEPASSPQGVKSLALRDELARRSHKIEPWGEIRGTVILLHGHKGRKEDHLPIAERFCAAGFRCLCIDLPGHGQNRVPYATFGHQEKTLLLSWWQEFQKEHPDASEPLFLFGISQGGAIALQLAAQKEWPVTAVASIASFTSLDQPIDRSADHLPRLMKDLKPLSTRACALGIYCHSGFFPQQISPLRAASNISCPVFLCHGQNDNFIPANAAEQLYAAVPHQQKKLRIISDAGHHNVLALGSTELYADLCEFFLRSL